MSLRHGLHWILQCTYFMSIHQQREDPNALIKTPLSLQPCYAWCLRQKPIKLKEDSNVTVMLLITSIRYWQSIIHFCLKNSLCLRSISRSTLLRVLRILLQYWLNRMYPVQQNLLWNVAKNLIIVLVWISKKRSMRLELAHHHTSVGQAQDDNPNIL